MALAPKTVYTYPLDGANRTFNINFEYLTRKFVQITLIGKDRKLLVLNQDYRFVTRTAIQTTIAWGPAQEYDTIEIRRFTSATERLVDFTDGSILRAYDLNIANVQGLHIAEEARDLTADTIAVNNEGDLDARGRKIVNVAYATNPGDAVTLGQVKSWDTSALNSSIAAKASADLAAQYAANAARSEANAKTYQDAAKEFARLAEISQIAAGVSEANANQSKTDAELYAQAALKSRNEAAQSALEAKMNTLRFLKPSATVPTTRDDGSALQEGDRYLNLTDYMEYIRKGSQWVANNVNGQLLAGSDGAKYIGMPGGKTLAEYLDDRDSYVTPEMFGYKDGGDLVANTKAVQDAHNAANATQKPVMYGGFYRVTHIILDTHREYAIIGSGALIGIDGSTQYDAVLTFKNCTGIKSFAQITVTASNLTNYACGVKVFAAGGTPGALITSSLLDLNFNVVGVALAWQFGDFSWPDNLLSEITISPGYTHNTPRVVTAIGTQAVIEFRGYQMIAAGSGSFETMQHNIAAVFGATIHINGGEVMLPGRDDGWTFQVSPVQSNSFANGFGNVYVNGASVEVGSLIAFALNSRGVTNVAAETGGVRLVTCTGYHSFQGSSFQAAPEFAGVFYVDGSSSFHSPARMRTQPIVDVTGAPVIDISDLAFDKYFMRGLNGMRGGIVRFSHRQIFEVSNLSGQTIPANQGANLKFQGIASSKLANDRFRSNYSQSTGSFTVPLGGLKSVRIDYQVKVPNPNNTMEMYVVVDGQAFVIHQSSSTYWNGTCTLGDLPAGAKIWMQFQNVSGTATTFRTDNSDRVTISACYF